jgi:hypothetical protein
MVERAKEQQVMLIPGAVQVVEDMLMLEFIMVVVQADLV